MNALLLTGWWISTTFTMLHALFFYTVCWVLGILRFPCTVAELMRDEGYKLPRAVRGAWSVFAYTWVETGFLMSMQMIKQRLRMAPTWPRRHTTQKKGRQTCRK